LPTLTGTGHVLGTVAYLSPEQARGLPVDSRSDIFSLGIILFEMVTGERPFKGETPADIVASLIQGELEPWPVQVAPQLRSIITRCLEKRPEDRFASAHDIAILLAQARESVSAANRGLGPSPRRALAKTAQWRVLTLGLCLSAGLAVSLLIRDRGIKTSVERKVRTEAPGDSAMTRPVVGSHFHERQLTRNPGENPVVAAAVSDDGRFLAFIDKDGLSVQVLHSGEVHPIAASREVDGKLGFVSWLPDGADVLVSAVGATTASTWVLPIFGGSPRRLIEDARFATVSPDGTRIAFVSKRGLGRAPWEIRVAALSGEEQSTVVSFPASVRVSLLAWSPDGQRIAFQEAPIDESSAPVLQTVLVSGGDTRKIVSNAQLEFGFTWLRDGRILYGSPRTTGALALDLWQVGTDLKSGAAAGPPVRVAAWVSSTRDFLNCVTASADARHMALLRWHSQSDIRIIELAHDEKNLLQSSRLTLDEGWDLSPCWVSGGRELVYTSWRSGSADILVQGADERRAKTLAGGPQDEWWPSACPDGASLFYWSDERGTPSKVRRLMRVSLNEGPPSRVLEVEVPGDARSVAVSCPIEPLASCILGLLEGDTLVFHRLDWFHGLGAKVDSVEAALVPNGWELSPDGTRVAFVSGDNRLHVRTLGSTRADDVVSVLAAARRTKLATIGWRPTGDGFVIAGSYDDTAVLVAVDLHGASRVLFRAPVGVTLSSPRVSPDGKLVAFEYSEATGNVWLIQDGGSIRPLLVE
jgi:Tol biopolymer transport system component